MNFEQEIHNQNNARRMNILKGFSDFSEDLLQKSEDGSELEKGHMDFSNQRVYADNSVNRKLNRVGQKYGGRNVEDEKGVDKKDNSEEERDENKPTPPQETQPNEQGQYSTEQLTEFAAQAEDWQLQEFLDNAKKSGDNSEYMQAQVNIAETELNRRRGGETSGEENVDSNNEKNFEQQESDYQENMSNVDENGLPDFNDIEAVKNFLNENPQIKDRALAIVNDDIFIPMKDAIKLANAETKSSGEAMKTVEAAKKALDEVYNKSGGNNSMNELDRKNLEISNEQHQLLAETFGYDGEDYEDADDFLSYARDNDDDGDFANLSDEDIKNWFETQKGAINGGESNPNNATEGIEGDERHMMRVQREKEGEKPSTSPAGEPNRAEQPTRENSDLEQEDSKDGILQEMDAKFGHLEGNWEKANPETYDTSDMPNLMSYEGSKKMDDADLQLLYNPDNSTYIVENYDNGDVEEFSSEEDVKNFLNEALDNIAELRKFREEINKLEDMPEYFGKKVTRVSPWGDDKIIIEHPDGSERTLKPGDKHYDELVKFKTDTNRFDDNTNSENQSSNDKERTNEANKNSNQYGVDKVSQKSLQNIYDSGEHYEDAEDFRESVRDYNNEDSGVSDLSDKEIETWFDLYNSDKRKY